MKTENFTIEELDEIYIALDRERDKLKRYVKDELTSSDWKESYKKSIDIINNILSDD